MNSGNKIYSESVELFLPFRNSRIGYTDNLRRRLREHNNKNPDLVYYEAYKNIKDAQERERKLKQRGQSVRWLKERLRYSLEK